MIAIDSNSKYHILMEEKYFNHIQIVKLINRKI